MARKKKKNQSADLIWVAVDEVVGCLYDFLLVLWIVSLQLYCCYLTFCHFMASEMLYEIKCKQDEDKGKEGRMPSVGGDSNKLCCLPNMAFITATIVGEKQTA